MNLERKNNLVKPHWVRPYLVFFNADVDRFIPFLFIIPDSGTPGYSFGFRYTKKRRGFIFQDLFYSPIIGEAKKVAKGTLVIIDEFEKQGGCEDDLWA